MLNIFLLFFTLEEIITVQQKEAPSGESDMRLKLSYPNEHQPHLQQSTNIRALRGSKDGTIRQPCTYPPHQAPVFVCMVFIFSVRLNVLLP